MPIKAIRLRAGFLLLLLTLMSISANFVITEINAETLEESFKNTPIPFWEIDNENCLTQYGTNTQDVLFSYGEWLEDFNDISDWSLSLIEETESLNVNNGIDTFLAKGNSPNDRDNIYTNSPSIDYWGYIEIRYKMSSLESYSWVIYIQDEDSSLTDKGRISFNLIETVTWQIDKWNKDDYNGMWNNYDGSFENILIQGRNNEGINVEIDIDYIHVWKDYQENRKTTLDFCHIKLNPEKNKIMWEAVIESQAITQSIRGLLETTRMILFVTITILFGVIAKLKIN